MAWILILRVLAVIGVGAIGYFVYRKIKLEINKGKSEHRMMKRAVHEHAKHVRSARNESFRS